MTYGIETIKQAVLTLVLLVPGCELRFTVESKPTPQLDRPIRKRVREPIPNPTGHDAIDRMGGWEAIEEKRRSIPRKEYDAWLEEHRRSQDGPFIGNGG